MRARESGFLGRYVTLGGLALVLAFCQIVAAAAENQRPDPAWVRRAVGGALLVIALASAVLVYVFRLNGRLRREVVERKAAEVKFRGLVDQSLAGIYLLQEDRFTYVNSKFAEIFGYSPEEIAGTLGPMDLCVPAGREKVEQYFRKSLSGEGDAGACPFVAAHRSGTLIEVEMNGRFVEYEGRPAVIGMALDVTERNRIQKQLNHMAFYDPLTDLPNRALFFDRLSLELARCKRSMQTFGLLLLDLDGFKAVNDTLGHETGDALLQSVARRLLSCVRDSDTVARTGGDEFVVILHFLAGPENVVLVAERILAAFEKPFVLSGRECRVGASIGICVVPEDGEDMEILLSRADAAMYASKARGRNTWTRFRPELTSNEPVRTVLLPWTDDLLIGVPAIDKQHAQLASVLNRVAEAVKTGQSQERIRSLLEELLALTRYHFETEERLMERVNYAGREAHVREHRTLVVELLRIQRQLDQTSLMLTLRSLKDWFANHIDHGDREMGQALIAAKGRHNVAELLPQVPWSS